MRFFFIVSTCLVSRKKRQKFCSFFLFNDGIQEKKLFNCFFLGGGVLSNSQPLSWKKKEMRVKKKKKNPLIILWGSLIILCYFCFRFFACVTHCLTQEKVMGVGSPRVKKELPSRFFRVSSSESFTARRRRLGPPKKKSEIQGNSFWINF